LAKEGKGTVYQSGNKTWIYIPKEVAMDSQFPFRKGEKVKIILDMEKGELTVRKTQ